MLPNREALESIQKRPVTIKIKQRCSLGIYLIHTGVNQIPYHPISKCTQDKCSVWFACAELGAVISAETELCGPRNDWDPLFAQEGVADLMSSSNSVKH